jgi:hypothetical protein
VPLYRLDGLGLASVSWVGSIYATATLSVVASS